MALTASKTASCVMAMRRAWLNGLLAVVATAIAFQSRTTSALTIVAVPSSAAVATMERKMFFMGSTIAALPGASLSGFLGFSQVNSDAEHHAAGIDEHGRQAEVRRERRGRELHVV